VVPADAALRAPRPGVAHALEPRSASKGNAPTPSLSRGPSVPRSNACTNGTQAGGRELSGNSDSLPSKIACPSAVHRAGVSSTTLPSPPCTAADAGIRSRAGLPLSGSTSGFARRSASPAPSLGDTPHDWLSLNGSMAS